MPDEPIAFIGRVYQQRGKRIFRPIVVRCPKHGEFNAERCPECAKEHGK